MRHRAGPGQVLGRFGRRQGLHLPPAPGGDVPQRQGADGGGREEELRALPGQEDQVPAARQLQLHQGHGGRGQVHDQVHPRQAGQRIPGEVPSAGGLHHPLGQLRVQAAQAHRHGRVRVRGVAAQAAREVETVQELLEEGRQGEPAPVRGRGRHAAHPGRHRALHVPQGRQPGLGLDGAVRAGSADQGESAQGNHSHRSSPARAGST